jgi:hypothetical protein
MPMPTTRISDNGLRLLRELSRDLNQPQPAVLDEALETLRRKRFFERLNQQYARLRTDSAAWDEELADRRLWDRTSSDSSPG